MAEQLAEAVSSRRAARAPEVVAAALGAQVEAMVGDPGTVAGWAMVVAVVHREEVAQPAVVEPVAVAASSRQVARAPEVVVKAVPAAKEVPVEAAAAASLRADQ
jgi:hypothetical protein